MITFCQWLVLLYPISLNLGLPAWYIWNQQANDKGIPISFFQRKHNTKQNSSSLALTIIRQANHWTSYWTELNWTTLHMLLVFVANWIDGFLREITCIAMEIKHLCSHVSVITDIFTHLRCHSNWRSGWNSLSSDHLLHRETSTAIIYGQLTLKIISN